MTLPTHITDYLKINAQKYPHKKALVCSNRTFTWAELSSEVAKVAAAIGQRIGNDEQKIVSTLFPNSWELVVTYLGILEAGHIALPLDIIFKAMEIEAITSQIPPALTITIAANRHSFPADDNRVVLLDDLLNKNAGHGKPLRIAPEKQIASMLFTSGTTGKPKAAPYTHANHLWTIATSSKLYKWTTEDTLLLSLPLSHWHGLVMGISGALYHGNTIYLQERLDPEAMLTVMASGEISLFMHVSLAYTKMVQHAPEKKYNLNGVRLCISASSALPPKIWNAFKERFGIEILERYGSSEAGCITSNILTERIPGSPGKAIPGTELALHENGELKIKTPALFPGYWNNEEATQKNLLPDGWWLTGDMAEFDAEGHVFLKGRIQEKIKKFGYSLSPRDLEWALQNKNPKVKEVFVMGIQHSEESSDTLAYFIVGDITEEEIIAHCKKNLPSAWRPDRIFILDAIPRTRSGKPILSALKGML